VNGPEAGRPEHGESIGEEPQIYVASLSDYNAGILHGEWISAETDPDTVQGSVDRMLAASPTARRFGDIAEEWAIHDFSGFGAVRLSEHEDLERVCAIARGISTHGEPFAAWVADRDDDESPDNEGFEEDYLGEWASATDWAESLLEDIGVSLDNLDQVPESLQPYVHIDVQGWVRDMQIDGEVSVVDSKAGVYVFWRR